MIFNISTMAIKDRGCKYEIFFREHLVCYLRGFFYCSGRRAGKESIDVLLNQYIETGNIDFKIFYGAYHIILLDKKNDKTIFFGDNAGFCCFYYNIQKALISDSFLELTEASQKITPNYDAITEFIYFNCIYSNETICREILRTDAMYYYIFENSKLICETKGLDILETEGEYKNLHEFMKDLLYAAKDLKIIAIITGGTDSRTVLSHLNALGVECDLAISGREQIVDVQIAKKIAERLEREIHISDEDVDNTDEDWLRELFMRSDGVFGLFSRYRLHKKSNMLEKLGVQLEIGGVGGELYKNSFLNQDFPFYRVGKVNKKKFYKLKINPLKVEQKYLTATIINSTVNMEKRIIEKVFDKKMGEKRKTYFRAGAKIMRYRMVTLSNSSNLSISSISPFMEIDVMKLTYNENPWKLELNKWQRKEVSIYCPQIADIKTDRGLTLQNNKMQILKEFILSYAFLFKVGLKRTLFRKMQKNASGRRLDVFVKGRELKEFELAMSKCKELNILKNDCKIESIPDILVDRLMTIGLVFMNFRRKIN